METLVAVGFAVGFAWFVARICAPKPSRVAVGYYVSPCYRAKRDRAVRSEFAAQQEMIRGIVR